MKSTLTLVTILLYSTICNAQNILESQTLVGNLNINPSLAGNTTGGRIALSSKITSPKQTYPLSSSFISYYQYIPKLNGYGGIQNQLITNQVYIGNTSSLFYSQNIKLGKVLVRPSLKLNYSENKIDYSHTPLYNIPVHYYKSYGVNLGGMFYYNKFIFGISYGKSYNPTSIFDKTVSIISLQTAYLFEINKLKLNITPYILTNNRSNDINITTGTNLLYNKHINFAYVYRLKHDMVFNIGYQNDKFSINYSYDGFLHDQSFKTSGGIHQLGLTFNVWKIKPHAKYMEIKSIF